MRFHPDNEKETLASRQITLTLSDFEVDELCRYAGARGITAEKLLEDFIGNLVDGYHYCGSDEKMFAREYLDRVIYSFDDDESFLQWLANFGDLKDVAVRLEIIEEETGEDEGSQDEIDYQYQKIDESFEKYLSQIGEERAEKINREEELQKVKDFVRSWEKIKGESIT